MAEGCLNCNCCSDSDQRYQALDEIINKYRNKPGALIPVLHQAEQLFGYLPEEVQIKVAEGLDVPLSEVYGVITFYSFFSTKPRGKYTIGVCLGTACYVKGAAQVLQAVKDELGIEMDDTTDDGLFTLTVTRCLGACGLAPVMMIGDDVYGRLTPERIPEILNSYRKESQQTAAEKK